MLNKASLNQLNNMPRHLSEHGYFNLSNLFNINFLEQIISSYDSLSANFKPAKISKGNNKSINKEVRNDSNLWLTNSEQSFQPIWHLQNLISQTLKKELFLPIKRYETQLSLYSPNQFYKRHADKHSKMPARLISQVFYLSDWSHKNQGELIIYKIKNNIKIAPIKNSLIIFLSELEHEVLPTKQIRKSITTWYRNDIL